jgi:selenocysteine lyase/cysteine desulfurase
VKELAAMLRTLIGEVPGVTVRDLGPNPAAIVTFTLDQKDAASVASHLAERLIWLTFVVVTSVWAVSILSAMIAAVSTSMYRAARVRLAVDRGQKARYPRKQMVR